MPLLNAEKHKLKAARPASTGEALQGSQRTGRNNDRLMGMTKSAER